MAQPTKISGLSPREAVADALNRCILGIDTNNRELMESALVKDDSITMSLPNHNIQGWSQFNQTLDIIFKLNTTHFVTNVRVDLKDDAATTASMTAHAIAYHVRPDNAFTPENTSYTAGTLYSLDLVKDEEADGGLWRIQKWVVQTNWTYGHREAVFGP